MKNIKFLEGEKAYLRPVQEEDAQLVYLGKNSCEVRERLFLFAPLTLEQIKKEMTDWTNSSDKTLFTICDKIDNAAVGQTALVRIDYVSRAAVFYIAIYNPEYWSKGIGGEASKLMLDYAFNTLNLNRIQLHVCVENESAVKAYKRCGYKIEGKLRKAMYLKNKYYDFYVMGILRNEYYKMKFK